MNYKTYKDPYFPSTSILLGLKGKARLSTDGAVYDSCSEGWIVGKNGMFDGKIKNQTGTFEIDEQDKVEK